MELIHKYLLVFHASCGGLALLAGTLAFSFRKGGERHVKIGRLFSFLMIATGVSALILALINPNPFLLGIGFFTLYMVFSGWVWIRRLSFKNKVKRAKMIGSLGILIAGYMIFTALSSGKAIIVLLVFAIILLIMSVSDVLRKPKPNKTAGLHGGRMGGAYIAALTAFLVVNNTFLPNLLAWLGPTVIVSPIIAIQINAFYKGKKK